MQFTFNVIDSAGGNSDLIASMALVAQAAGSRLASFLTGSATIEVQIDITNIDVGGTGTATGRSATSAFVGSVGGIDIFQQGATQELVSGVDPNGSTDDILITAFASYLRNFIQFDPTPFDEGQDLNPNRTDMVSVIMHELIHGLSFNGFRNVSTGALTGNFESTFDQFIDPSASTFTFNGGWTLATFGSPVNLTHNNIFHYGNTEDIGSPIVDDGLMNGVVFRNGFRYDVDLRDLVMMLDTGVPVAGAIGTTGDDFLSVGATHFAVGGLGNDTIVGGAQDDILAGGVGTDKMDGGGGDDIIDGGPGEDTADFGWTTQGVVVNLATSQANGPQSGADEIKDIENAMGGSGNDTIVGNAADNLIDGGPGADSMSGGQGNDTYVVDNAGDVVTEIPGQGTDTLETAQTFIALGTNLENITFTGTVGLNVGIGNILDNVLTGSSGSDSFTGNFGNDTFIAGAGDDYLYIDHLDVSINAGSGFDAIFMQDNTGTNLNLAAANVEWVYAWIGNDTLDATGSTVGVSLVGEAGADVLRGSAQTDYLYIDNFDTLIDAADGFDALFVYQGNGQGVIDTTINVAATNAEWALGGAGNDIITNFGDATSVTLSGGAGNDTITGGLANDFLYGNVGADTFMVTSSAQFDAILDFQANVDKVDLTAISTIQDFADLQAVAFEDGSGNTIFSLGGGNQLFLYQITLASLDANDFIF